MAVAASILRTDCRSQLPHPDYAHHQRLSLLLSYLNLYPVASHNHPKFTKCSLQLHCPKTIAQPNRPNRLVAKSHQNFGGEFRLSSTLRQEPKQRHHLLLGARQAVGDDMGTSVLCGRHIQQQRVPEGFRASAQSEQGWEHG